MHTWLICILVVWLIPPAFALQTQQDQGMVVGHLTYIQGNVLRQVNDGEKWVALVEDSPVGVGDILYAEDSTRAEIIIPNNTWVRMGRDTYIQITGLEHDRTDAAIETGTARFYNKSTSATITANTPFGSVLGPPLTTFDVYLDKDSVQVIALAGAVTFHHIRDNSNHEVRAGLSSLRADYHMIMAENAVVDEDFNLWNAKRDGLWEERFEARTETQHYLPENLQYASYALQENGVWETVYYQGRNCSFWRPTRVSSYWSPFTVGSWTVWYGDHCWIPYEPFGYVTHHYGNWIYIDSCDHWYWAPPVCHNRINVITVFPVPFAWYPGRVSWIYNDDCIGWIPLAPFEPYYGHHNWGPHAYIAGRDTLRRVSFHRGHGRYKKHAVIVKKIDFYNTINYDRKRIRNIGEAGLDAYRRVSVLPDTGLNNFKNVKRPLKFKAPRAQHKLTTPAVKKQGLQQPRDVMLTRRVMPVNQKRVDTGSTANPISKRLSKNHPASGSLADINAQQKGGGQFFRKTSMMPQRTQGVEPARTKLRERPRQQEIISRPIRKLPQTLPSLKSRRVTISQPPVSRSASSPIQIHTQRPARIIKIQPERTRSKLPPGRQNVRPPLQTMKGGGNIINNRGNSFPRAGAQ